MPPSKVQCYEHQPKNKENRVALMNYFQYHANLIIIIESICKMVSLSLSTFSLYRSYALAGISGNELE